MLDTLVNPLNLWYVLGVTLIVTAVFVWWVINKEDNNGKQGGQQW